MRERKRKERIMDYIVFDLEWNQGRSGKSRLVKNVLLSGEIIQIGAVKVDSAMNVLDYFSMRVAPEIYTELNRNVAEITGIDQSTLENGVPFADASAGFFSWCGDDCMLCAWGPNDLEVLLQNMRIHGMATSELPPVVDLQKLFSIQVLGDSVSCCSLLRALEILDEPALDAHDALNDADNTVSVMWHLDMENSEDLALCVTRASNCLKAENFSIRCASERALLSDISLRYFVSPSNGKKALCGSWIRTGNRCYESRATDAAGNLYRAVIEFRPFRDGYRVSRKIWECDGSAAGCA